MGSSIHRTKTQPDINQGTAPTVSEGSTHRSNLMNINPDNSARAWLALVGRKEFVILGRSKLEHFAYKGCKFVNAWLYYRRRNNRTCSE